MFFMSVFRRSYSLEIRFLRVVIIDIRVDVLLRNFQFMWDASSYLFNIFRYYLRVSTISSTKRCSQVDFLKGKYRYPARILFEIVYQLSLSGIAKIQKYLCSLGVRMSLGRITS